MTPKVRIALLSAGIVVLLALAAGLLLRPAAPSADVGRKFDTMLGQLEARKADDVIRQTVNPSVLSINGVQVTVTRWELSDRLTSLYNELTYLAIRPETTTVTLGPDGEHAAVRCVFHWSVANKLYPNARATSERENPGGKPDVATVAFQKEDSEWFVSSVTLELQSR